MHGRFVWHDLMTLDGERARAFYPELLGWKLVPMKMGSFTVWLIEHGGQRIGTIMEEKGIPSSHWMPYASVESTDDACKRIAELGGKVCIAPTEIPKLGRFAVVEDRQGGVFSVIRRPDGTPEPPPPGPGQFVWNELLTGNPESAAKFYSQLLGWNLETTQTNEEGPYRMTREGQAGILQTPKGAPPRAHWIGYLAAEDVDVSTGRAKALGARINLQPTDIPNVGRYAIVTDPTGATFALFKSLQKM